ncbi:MAG: hypothetical protein KBB55_02040 [Candidatus Buchananbacteria bacterium]|nr:hypothetical protein [Candidatus Buchananbacteria bacterium]
MDYSSIETVKTVLTRRNIPIPVNEEEARQKAFEALLEMDFLLAHSIRLGRNYREFTDDQWRDVIQISGEKAVREDTRALIICVQMGILVCPELHLGGSTQGTVEQS